MELEEITYKVNGCAMKVQNTLGNGFQEVIYQRCLAIELSKSGLIFAKKLNKLFIIMILKLEKDEPILSSKIKWW